MVSLTKTAYGGWQNCYRLSNDIVDLVITAEVGPRIIRFGFVGQANEFAEFADDLGQTGGDQWRNYGGHRLWHAPEAQPRTYYPDNQPVEIDEQPGGVRVVQATEPTTGIGKGLEISLEADVARVRVVHRLRNDGLWPVKLAPWALSVMAPGGTGIVPLPPRGTHPQDLLPTSWLVLWAYTDMSDPRWTWGRRYVLLRQDADAPHPQKVGVHCLDGWAAYARAGHLFVKRFSHTPRATYPDLGASVEVYTERSMLEVETLGPLVELEPGAAVEHVEMWELFDGVPTPQDERAVAEHIAPLAS